MYVYIYEVSLLTIEMDQARRNSPHHWEVVVGVFFSNETLRQPSNPPLGHLTVCMH
jgi:hypothetical protein